jgi:hypothetical protein
MVDFDNIDDWQFIGQEHFIVEILPFLDEPAIMPDVLQRLRQPFRVRSNNHACPSHGVFAHRQLNFEARQCGRA